MEKRERLILIALTLLAVIGLVDSVVIHEKVSGVINVSCIVGQGCDSVLNSVYSNFLGIPLSLWGIAFYSLLVMVLALRIASGKKIFENTSFFMIGGGFLFSLYLFYIQALRLGDLCTYCMVSFSDMTLAIAFLVYFRRVRGISLQA
jgi:uncharacterized membrane protein